MNYPQQIIVIAVMAGIVAAGFTWFGWELLENIFARSRRGKLAPNTAEPHEQGQR